MIIGFDIDGVLTDFETFITNYGSKYLKTTVKNMNEIKISQEDISTMFLCSKAEEEAFWAAYISFYCKKYPSRLGMADIMKQLHKKHKIIIITNRFDDNVSPKTMQKWVKAWLKKERIPYDELIFNQGSKLASCLEHQIDVMIEDTPKHLEELSPYIPCICFNAYYNTECTGKNISRCYSAYDLLAHLQSLDKLQIAS